MQYILDAVFLAIFALTVFFAAKKGFFKSLFDLLAYVIALVAARFVSVAVSPVAFEQYFSPTIHNRLTQQLADSSALNYTEKIEAALNSIPDYLDGILQTIGIDKDAIAAQVSSAELKGDNIVEALMEKIITPVGTAIIQMLLFIVLAIVFRLILQVVVRLLNNVVKKLPAIKQMNSVLGGVLGAVKGLIIVVLAALLVGAVAGAVRSEPFVNAVDNSLVIRAVRSIISSVSGQVF